MEPPKIGEGVEGLSVGVTNSDSSALTTTERRMFTAIAGLELRLKVFRRVEAPPMAGFAAIDAHFMLAMVSQIPVSQNA